MSLVVGSIDTAITWGIKSHPGLYLGSLIKATEKQKASTFWPALHTVLPPTFQKATAAPPAHTATSLTSPFTGLRQEESTGQRTGAGPLHIMRRVGPLLHLSPAPQLPGALPAWCSVTANVRLGGCVLSQGLSDEFQGGQEQLRMCTSHDSGSIPLTSISKVENRGSKSSPGHLSKGSRSLCGLDHHHC